MSTYTKEMSKEQIQQLQLKLKKANVCPTPPYALFQIKTSDCTITAYQSGKVVFQGEGAELYKESKPEFKRSYPECGSDEVGTGDYFGPVVVCACCVEEKHLTLLNQLKIQDSKQLKDEDILEIAPILMNHLTYSLLVLENEKYNHVHQQHNMNAIKAKLHNQAFIHLQTKVTIEMNTVIIDQFTPETSYYRYLKDEDKIFSPIHFETKAENKYLSVACSSIIARYTFLEALAQMTKQYQFTFIKGAGSLVDDAGVMFLEQHGFHALQKVAKIHFKNTEKIKAKVNSE